jgi:hypothetical protein
VLHKLRTRKAYERAKIRLDGHISGEKDVLISSVTDSLLQLGKSSEDAVCFGREIPLRCSKQRCHEQDNCPARSEPMRRTPRISYAPMP